MRLCPSNLLFIVVVILLGGMSMLSACGKKGPLYLHPEPVQEPAQEPAVVPESPAPAPHAADPHTAE